MTFDEELFCRLYRMLPCSENSLIILDRYVCRFKARKEDDYRELVPFTSLQKDSNSCAKQTYADLDVFDNEEKRFYHGRFCMAVNDDLGDASKFSFMLCLKENENDDKWLTSFALPANSIESNISFSLHQLMP